jgi:hypothetical protein
MAVQQLGVDDLIDQVTSAGTVSVNRYSASMNWISTA